MFTGTRVSTRFPEPRENEKYLDIYVNYGGDCFGFKQLVEREEFADKVKITTDKFLKTFAEAQNELFNKS
ncbi:hypothetical protein [Brevibacillus borstelensis]|uniref:hypothetical protein n=1 Tax=Brevibacillus borstelensis TaxID=45462 RepID=UPI0030BF79A7